jgi:hypothetical protein
MYFLPRGKQPEGWIGHRGRIDKAFPISASWRKSLRMSISCARNPTKETKSHQAV